MKRTAGTLLLASALFAGVGICQDPTEAALLRLEDERIQAMVAGDIPTLERILSPDLSYTHSTGRVETRQEYLDSLRAGRTKYRSMRREDVRVRVFGSTAVITGRAQVEVTTEGEARAFPIRFTDVYVDKDGRWTMVAWQSRRRWREDASDFESDSSSREVLSRRSKILRLRTLRVLRSG